MTLTYVAFENTVLMSGNLSKVEQVCSYKWTTVGHLRSHKSASDVFCPIPSVPDKKETKKKRHRGKKLQRSACYKRSPVRWMPSGRMMRDLKGSGSEEGKEGLEGDPGGTMPKVTRKNAVRRATKTPDSTHSIRSAVEDYRYVFHLLFINEKCMGEFALLGVYRLRYYRASEFQELKTRFNSTKLIPASSAKIPKPLPDSNKRNTL